MVFHLFSLEISSEGMETRLIVTVPLLKFVDCSLKVVDKLVDRKIIVHHFFVKNPTLIRIFCLNEQWKLSKERPRFKVVWRSTSVECCVVTEEHSVFNKLLFRPLVTFSKARHLSAFRVSDFKGTGTDDFHSSQFIIAIWEEKIVINLVVSSAF